MVMPTERQPFPVATEYINLQALSTSFPMGQHSPFPPPITDCGPDLGRAWCRLQSLTCDTFVCICFDVNYVCVLWFLPFLVKSRFICSVMHYERDSTLPSQWSTWSKSEVLDTIRWLSRSRRDGTTHSNLKPNREIYEEALEISYLLAIILSCVNSYAWHGVCRSMYE